MTSCLPACLRTVSGWVLPIYRFHELQSVYPSLLVACRRASAAGFGGASAAELAALRQQAAEQQSQLDQKDAMLQDLRDLLVGHPGQCAHADNAVQGCLQLQRDAQHTGGCSAGCCLLDVEPWAACQLSKHTPQVAHIVRPASGRHVKMTGTSGLKCADLTRCLCPAVCTQDLPAGV